MSTQLGDVAEDQLVRENTSMKEAEGLHQETNFPELPESTQEVIEVSAVPVVDEPVVDERLERLNEISRKSKEGDFVEPPVPVQQDEEQLDLPIWRSDDGTYRTRLKIDGVDVERDFNSVIADAQKVRAADQRFRDAAALSQENEMLKAQIAQSRTQPPIDVGVSGLPNDGQQGITSETFNKAILDGDEQAYQQVLSRLNQPPVDQAGMIAETRRLMREEQQQLEIQNVLTSASKSDPIYNQILNDTAYKTVANEFTKQLQYEQPNLSASENITMALQMTAERLNLRAPALSSRTAGKKQHAQSNLQSSGSTRSPLVQEQQAPTAKMVRAQMREARLG
jgi:hypothetical protein